MRAWLALASAALAISAAPSAAEPAAPVDREVVIAAVATCVAATATGPLDRAMIEAAGWSVGTLEAGGEVRPNAMEIRSHADSHLLMTTPPGEDMCIIVGPVAKRRTVAAIRADMLATYPGAPIDMGEVGHVWPSGNHFFGVAETGRENTPAVRIVVKARGSN